jgi:uncharacterized membrane protein
MYNENIFARFATNLIAMHINKICYNYSHTFEYSPKDINTVLKTQD